MDRGGNISNTIGGGCSAATALWPKHTCRSQTGYHHYHYTIQQIQRQCLYGYQSVASVVKSYVSSLVCAYNHRMCHSLQQSGKLFQTRGRAQEKHRPAVDVLVLGADNSGWSADRTE